MPQATSLAAELESTFGVQPKLIRDKGGKFEVYADGRLIYSKLATDRFPENSEVIDALKQVG